MSRRFEERIDSFPLVTSDLISAYCRLYIPLHANTRLELLNLFSNRENLRLIDFLREHYAQIIRFIIPIRSLNCLLM